MVLNVVGSSPTSHPRERKSALDFLFLFMETKKYYPLVNSRAHLINMGEEVKQHRVRMPGLERIP